MTSKKTQRGYRRTAKNAMGRPKIPTAELKRFKGTIKFDEKLERALKEEQERREKLGEVGNRSAIMRSLLIKGLRDLGHDLDEPS